MTKFEFTLPHAAFDVNAFFEGQGHTVSTRVRTGVGQPWSVVLREDLTQTKRDEVAAALAAEGVPGLIKDIAEPIHTGSAKERETKHHNWMYAPAFEA